MQSLDEIDLSDFIHGGVNITGFNLIDSALPKVSALQRELVKPGQKSLPVATASRKLRVRIQY